MYFSSDAKMYHPEASQLEGAIERSFHMRHTIKPIQSKLQSSIYVRIGMKEYQCLFKQGNELPLTKIINASLLPHERKKFFIEIAGESNGLSNIQTIETALLSIPKEIEEKMNKTKVYGVQLQILIDDLGTIKIWFLNEEGTYDFDKIKHVGNIGILNSDADRVNEKLSYGLGIVDSSTISSLLHKKK